MDLSIKCLPGVMSQQFIDRLQPLAERVFDEIEPDYIIWRVRNMPDVTLFVAMDGPDWVGFKCGYAMTKRRYYSWLGGVDPEYRNHGIASKLMQAQHEWVTNSAYELVETHVRQDNASMVLANRKFGYKVKGRFRKDDEVNLIMQLGLAAST